MDAEVTVVFHIRSVCNPEDITEDTSFEDIVRQCIHDEGLFGLVDDGDMYILSPIKEWRS